mmetsp:Transcript_7829/g.13198  ORF Transcript_7829/g.13198 Transcript_7829/m.13198 type:complete len:349 (-) Transcript_7829:495-1541(-)
MLLTAFLVLVLTVVEGGSSGLPVVNKADLRVHSFSLGGLLVDEERQIMFCPIEKVASTQFRQLFYRLSGDENWFEPPYHKKDSPRLGHFSLERARHMLTSAAWTRAVVLRDPAKRLLSSYMHLVLNPKTPARYRTALSDRHRNITWPDFVGAVLEKDGYDNIHWTPQSQFCGLRRFHGYFNFVGNFEQLRAHGELLIARAGLQNATSAGWGKVSYVKSPVRVGTTPESRRREYITLLRGYVRKNVTGDCMWCKNLALHKNKYQHDAVASMLTRPAWLTLRNSAVYAPDYTLFEQLQSVPPFEAALYNQHDLVLRDDLPGDRHPSKKHPGATKNRNFKRKRSGWELGVA